MRMTKQEWENLTEEDRLKLFEELEEEKDDTDKALVQFLKKKSKLSNNEKWIAFNGYNGKDFAFKVSDIEYIEPIGDRIYRVHTKIICDGQKVALDCVDNPYKIVENINGNS